MQPGDPFAALNRLLQRPAWMADAACREHPELNFHPAPGDSPKRLKQVCAGCLVRDDCLAYALDHDALNGNGFWGGLSPRDRRRLRAKRTSPAA